MNSPSSIIRRLRVQKGFILTQVDSSVRMPMAQAAPAESIQTLRLAPRTDYTDEGLNPPLEYNDVSSNSLRDCLPLICSPHLPTPRLTRHASRTCLGLTRRHNTPGVGEAGSRATSHNSNRYAIRLLSYSVGMMRSPLSGA
jgi:hypothetical protein